MSPRSNELGKQRAGEEHDFSRAARTEIESGLQPLRADLS